MKRKVLVLDIDGTLTNSKKEITSATQEAIFELQRRGHVVVLASGRPTAGLRVMTEKLRFAEHGGYILSYNGGCVTYVPTGETVFKNLLPDYVPAWMHAYALEHNIGMCTYLGQSMLCGTACGRYLEYERRINGLDLVQVDSFEPYIHTDFYKVLLAVTPTRAEEIEKRLQHRFWGRLSIYRSEPYFIEVMPRGVDKASAIAGLLERLGLEREDTIACGDGLNDLGMIRYAGLGVAMGNAQPAVKEAADIVTLTNDEDGLVPVIEKYILNAD